MKFYNFILNPPYFKIRWVINVIKEMFYLVQFWNGKEVSEKILNELKEKIFKSEEKLQSNNSAQIDYNLDFNLQKNYSISKNDINNSFLFTESGFEKEVVQ